MKTTVMGKIVLFFGMIILCMTLVGTNAWAGREKPVKLLFGSFDPPIGNWSPAIDAWAKDLEKKTNGRLTVQMTWSGALGRMAQFYDMVVKGVCDVAHFIPAVTPGIFPLADIISLPYVVPTGEIGNRAVMEFYKKGYLDKEFEDVKLIVLFTGRGDVILTKDKPISRINDLKGLKMNTAAPPVSNRIKLLGGVPTTLGGPMDVYPGLEKGVLDGAVFTWGHVKLLRIHEVIRYATEPGMGTVLMAIAMNKGKFNRLPEDVQAIIDGMTQKHTMNFGTVFDENCNEAKKAFLDSGGQIIKWESEALDKMDNLLAPMWNRWITYHEKRGRPAKKAVEDLYYILKDQGVDKPAIGFKPGK